MTLVSRVLPTDPITSFEAYLAAEGGDGLEAALAMEPAEVIELITASGLRGRGGAGFPTGVKWTTVVDNGSDMLTTTVVVNAAEGEPSTFKDRAILRANPYGVLEGALIAAWAVGASRVIVALKTAFTTERAILDRVVTEIAAQGWTDGLEVEIFDGPMAYLLGEETALLEAIDGRPPFPRIAPPYRRGVDEVMESASDIDGASGLSARVELAGPEDDIEAPPALIDNVETLANVAHILRNGAEWFRSVGTWSSPGTIVCTVTGDVQTPGVGEVAMGTPLSEVIDLVGGGTLPNRRVAAVLPGVSSAVLTAERLFTPLTYDDMTEAGSGLGSASFAVYDEHADMAAVAAGVSRFLYVESCGQCTACKQDGATISFSLDSVIANRGTEADLATIQRRLATVADGARCALATQHEVVVGSLVNAFEGSLQAHVHGDIAPTQRALVTELMDLDEDGAVLDQDYPSRQPDWSDDPIDSGMTPVERLMGDEITPS